MRYFAHVNKLCALSKIENVIYSVGEANLKEILKMKNAQLLNLIIVRLILCWLIPQIRLKVQNIHMFWKSIATFENTI